jgi:hypothetical protein
MIFKSLSDLPEADASGTFWKQHPITLPQPDLELPSESWIERGAEVIGWWFARFEHWLSRSGWLRAWLRFCLWLCITLTAAGLLLLPAVSTVLAEFAVSTHWIAIIVSQVASSITMLPPVLISLGLAYLIYLAARRVWMRRRGRTGFRQHEDYYQ